MFSKNNYSQKQPSRCFFFFLYRKKKKKKKKPIKSTEEDKDVKPDQSVASTSEDSTRSTRRSFDGAIHSKELSLGA